MHEDFKLGDRLVQPRLRSIVLGDRTAHVEPKMMEVLVCLADHPGEVVSRENLLKAVWPGTFVSQGVLSRVVSELRSALGDTIRNPRFIQTIPKTGYRLVAPVEPLRQATRLVGPAGKPDLQSTDRSRRTIRRYLWVAAALSIGTLLVWLYNPGPPPKGSASDPVAGAFENEQEPAFSPGGLNDGEQ